MLAKRIDQSSPLFCQQTYKKGAYALFYCLRLVEVQIDAVLVKQYLDYARFKHMLIKGDNLKSYREEF